MNSRNQILAYLCEQIQLHQVDGVTLVAVDGDAGSGKTCLADEIAHLLKDKYAIIRSSIDGFHHSKELRYRRGKDSPEGFFYDSYNLSGLKSELLDPLSGGRIGPYRTKIFDQKNDTPDIDEQHLSKRGAILIVDGLFLNRNELHDYWNYSIFLECTRTTCLDRCAARGDGEASIRHPKNQRYINGFLLYQLECLPHLRASVVINNEDLANPKLTKTEPNKALATVFSPQG
jgi:uridine kinase